jgi:hypothetical protein
MSNAICGTDTTKPRTSLSLSGLLLLECNLRMFIAGLRFVIDDELGSFE